MNGPCTCVQGHSKHLRAPGQWLRSEQPAGGGPGDGAAADDTGARQRLDPVRPEVQGPQRLNRKLEVGVLIRLCAARAVG